MAGKQLSTTPLVDPSAKLTSTTLGIYCEVGARTILQEVSMGDYSYVVNDSQITYTTIGKFCSIAANSRLNALEHPIERLTQHKVSYRPNEYFRWLGVDAAFRQRRQSKAVTIGHDVWIGHGAVIMPGLHIGNGAVVGANAVVTHDVAPYTIAAGVPAKLLRPRFAADIAARIERLAWWDWPVEKLARAVPDMQAMPIETFLDRWQHDDI